MKATHVWQEPASRDSKKYGQGWEDFSGKHTGYGKEKRKWQDWSQNDWKQESSQNDWSSYSTPTQKFYGTMDKDLGQYGWIMQDAQNGGEPSKMFVLPYSCPDMTLPPFGTRVEFTVVTDPKTGKPRAEDVVFEGASGNSKTDQWNPLPGLPGEVYTGTFCKERNTFGFIKPDQEFSEEVFVLPSACSGFFNNFPPLGTRVKFTLQPNKDKNSMMACEVTELDEGKSTFSREMRKGIMEKNLGNYGFIRDGEEAIFVLPGSCKGKQIFEPGTYVVYRKVPCMKTGGVRAESVEVDSHPPRLPEAVASLEAEGSAYAPEETGLKGVVVSTKDSYGFIQVEDSDTKVFLHIRQCPGRTLPPVGTELQFDKTLDHNRLNATNVSILFTPEPPEPAEPDEGEQQGEEETMEDPCEEEIMEDTPPEPELPRKARSKKSPEVAILWKRYCDENAEGLYDPSEHSALFLREFLHAVLPGDLANPAPKRQRTWDTKLTQVENKERQSALQPFQLLFKAQACLTIYASTKSWMKVICSDELVKLSHVHQPSGYEVSILVLWTLFFAPSFSSMLPNHGWLSGRCLGFSNGLVTLSDKFCQDFGWHLASRWFCRLGCQKPRCDIRPKARINTLEGFPIKLTHSSVKGWRWLPRPRCSSATMGPAPDIHRPLYQVICECCICHARVFVFMEFQRISYNFIDSSHARFHLIHRFLSLHISGTKAGCGNVSELWSPSLPKVSVFRHKVGSWQCLSA